MNIHTNFKRLTAILLCLALLFLTAVGAAAEDEAPVAWNYLFAPGELLTGEEVKNFMQPAIA